MTKRTISAILILLLILPALFTAGGVLFMQKSPFEEFDAEREASISDALGVEFSYKKGQEPLPDGERFVVKFKSDVPLSEIESRLEKVSYRILAESEQRFFAVSVKDESVLEAFTDVIDYYEPDLERGILAVTDDPATVPSYEPLGIYKAWDTVKASSKITVAVLDTGVDRSHEDLKDANILAGYDAVAKTAGVKDDTAGHGTGIVGLIAATADNKVGIAGVAHGAAILPVKVSSSGTTIYSSDLISGIRFAADAGAKIINMSVGGYSSSYAEQEAVNYAISKGCILIAAAGNGGNRPYADQKSYPASYDGVISVASCDENGERSVFSQFNDAVDIAAYGENIPLPFVEDGRSVYRYDSGTSYSCAFVSGIAALAASHVEGGARFESEEFFALIIDCLGTRRNDELGYGIIDAHQTVLKSSEPIITGVANNERYKERVTIGFNKGKATLDGESIEDGETVFSNGWHILEVTDGDFKKTVRFRLNYDPLSYDFKEFSSFAYFEFEKGTATLDGFPYETGTRISDSGRHVFVLKSEDEVVEKEVYLQYDLPAVFGVENGKVYNSPIDLRIVGDGSAFLNGKEIFGEAAVLENGKHTLVIKSGNGARSETIRFEVNFPYAEMIKNDLADAVAAIDEENGFACLYGESLVGARLYKADALQKYEFFLPLGRIYQHEFHEDKLILAGDGGITVIDRKNALDQSLAVEKTVSAEGMSYYAFHQGKAYCFGNESLYLLDLESGETEQIAHLGFDCENVICANGSFLIVSSENDMKAHFYSTESSETTEMNVGISLIGQPLYYDGNLLAVGNRLYDTQSGDLTFEFVSNCALAVRDGYLFTDSGIIDLGSGREIGSFAFSVADIVFGNENVYLFGFEKNLAIIKNGAEGIARFGAAERNEHAFSTKKEINVYRTHIFYDINSSPISVDASDKTVFVVFDNKNSLYGFSLDSFDEIEPIRLRFAPSSVSVTDGYVTVSFKNVPLVYKASIDDLENGEYVEAIALATADPLTERKILASRGNTAVTKDGAYSIDPDLFIGPIGVFGEVAAISQSNSVIALGKGIVSVCSYGDGSEISSLPEIKGVENGGIYLGKATISYTKGIGYLDGKPFSSGSSVNTAGEHVFTVSLPCGNSISVSFKIEAKISKIEFLVADRIMSVGETVSLRVRYLPEGASSLPVVFSSNSKGIEVNENGEVTAIAVGKYSVTATVSADYGKFTARATITVRDDLLTFPKESGIAIDRDRGLAIGIKAGTDIKDFEKLFKDAKSVDVVLQNGKNANGCIATGHKIVLYKNGLPADELIAVVTGDTDGDGYLSAYDLYVHERILRGYDYPPEFYASADMNGNGVVADNDYRALRNLILRNEKKVVGAPDKNLFGTASVQTLSVIEHGNIIDVVVCISGCKYARGVNGIIKYQKGLEFVEGKSTGWEIGFRDSEGEIAFYSYGENGESCGKAFKTLVNLRFAVKEDAPETIAFSSDGLTVFFPDGARVLKFDTKKVKLSKAVPGQFKIDILNADSFRFDENKFEYEVSIPYDSALADIRITHEENQTVSVSGSVVPDSGSSSVIIRLNDSEGNSRFYTIKVTRKKEPVFDTNCRLSSLEIEGFKLNPSFSPDVTEYNISVPRHTKKINVFCEAQSPTAKIVIGDTSLNGAPKVVEITVISPDGETMVYKINVSFIKEGGSIVNQKSGAPKAIIAAVLSILTFGSIGIFISKQKGK